jgi:hypothetical protein
MRGSNSRNLAAGEKIFSRNIDSKINYAFFCFFSKNEFRALKKLIGGFLALILIIVFDS